MGKSRLDLDPGDRPQRHGGVVAREVDDPVAGGAPGLGAGLPSPAGHQHLQLLPHQSLVDLPLDRLLAARRRCNRSAATVGATAPSRRGAAVPGRGSTGRRRARRSGPPRPATGWRRSPLRSRRESRRSDRSTGRGPAAPGGAGPRGRRTAPGCSRAPSAAAPGRSRIGPAGADRGRCWRAGRSAPPCAG